MALNLRQTIKQTQKLMMTPQLQQAINLLQFSRLELEQFINAELQENPTLEIDEATTLEEKINSDKEKETRDSDIVEINKQELVEILNSKDSRSEDLVNNDYESNDAFRNYEEQNSSFSQKKSNDEEGFSYESFLSKERTLAEHLLDQIGELNFDEIELKIAEHIIGNLNAKGYFELSLEELLISIGFDFQDHSEKAEGVLDTLQRLEPSGVCAKDLQECLLIQVRNAKIKNEFVETIIKNHMKELSTRNFALIARALKVPMHTVIEAVKIISELEPNPARQFGDDKPKYIVPDIYILKVQGKWIVSLNNEEIPNLTISNHYKKLEKKTEDSEAAQYLNEKIKSAQWLIKSLYQRQRTIFKVTESILTRQKDFFDRGVEYLRPMVLRDVAEEIGMHESTVSRATANKYVYTPRGIFELKYFFNSSVSTSDGDNMASEAVKNKIIELFKGENSTKPLSDQYIVEMLEKDGINIARRTVAKYREQLGILPSSKRKKYY
jgi:RNA polymerase sigma-54 factor